MKLKNQLTSLLSDAQEYLNFGGAEQVNELYFKFKKN